MRRYLACFLFSGAGAVSAQTTLDVTLPGGTSICSYTTGAVTSGSVAGHLSAIATAATPNCSAGGTASGVSFGPASLLAATNVTTNTGSSTITFQVLNANSCTGTVSGPGGTFPNGAQLCGPGSSLNPTCSGLISNTVKFNNTASPAANATITATCVGNTGPAVPSSVTISIPGTGTVSQSGCLSIPNATAGAAAFTAWSGNQNVIIPGAPAPVPRDVTSFASFFGQFEGRTGTDYYVPVPITKYMSLQFTVPNGYMATHASGKIAFNVGTSGLDTKFGMTISTTCGDFANPATYPTSTVVPGCYLRNGYSGAALLWANDGTCKLVDNQTYYYNLIPADIISVQPNGGGSASSNAHISGVHGCGVSSCSAPLTNGPFANDN